MHQTIEKPKQGADQQRCRERHPCPAVQRAAKAQEDARENNRTHGDGSLH